MLTIKEDNEPWPLSSEVPGIIIIASITITVFVVTAIIYSAIGFLCRHLVCQQHNQDKLTTPSSDNVQDTQKDAQQSHELDLQTNVA